MKVPPLSSVNMGRFTARRVLGLTTFAVLAAWCAGSYIITTPRKWTAGEVVQVCLFDVGGGAKKPVEGTAPGGLEESVEVRVRPSFGEEDLVPPRFISIPPGKTEACLPMVVPAVTQVNGKLEIKGRIGGKEVKHHSTISFATTVSETFVQTDKFIYMPGQKVHFRVLTVTGPYLKVFSGIYPAMWIESPSGSRIAQWTHVDSPAGLIHQELQLIAEPEEGTYKIHVESPVGGSNAIQKFKVEDFVLPRFEVTLEPPAYILATDKQFSYKVCAKYTYGQPVKGNVSFSIETKRWSTKDAAVLNEQINGCHVFTINENVLPINTHFDSVGVSVKVTEEGTGQEATAAVQMDVQRQALKFTHVGKEEYVKPNLPFTGEFKVKLPSGTPAANKIVTVCCQLNDYCKNYTTDVKGLVQYIYPKHEDFMIVIKSPSSQRIDSNSSRWQPIMYESSSIHTVKRYYSPSGSSLVIKSPQVKLKCRAGEKQEFSVPVLYSASQGISANFTIQLVSRGQIQFSHIEEHTFMERDLPIDASLLLFPVPPTPEGMVRGVVNLPLTVPLTSSPTSKVVVWYTREDGEVVSDAQEIKIKKCLTNQVSLTWSAERAEPGDSVDLAMTAAPDSLCSLGVVDKSVELLSSEEDHLTLDGVFKVAERAMVGEDENTQINDQEYCKENHSGEPHPPIPLPPRPLPPRIPIPVPLVPEEGERQLAKRSVWRPHGTYYTEQVDAIKMFNNAGLFVFTDLKVETRPCMYREPPYYNYDFYPDYAMELLYIREEVAEDPLPSSQSGNEASLTPMPVVYKEPQSHSSSSSPSSRSYFPDTWLWRITLVDSAEGTSSQRLTLPHTITEWVGKAVCVHPEKGVGLSKKSSITTFTPFFIDLTLPPSVQRGEILPVKISVFNYLEESLPVRVILARSEEYDILEDPTSGLVNGTRSSCIPSQDKVVHTVKVKPKVLGNVNLTVEAYVDEVFPEVCGPEYVISKRDHLIKPIRVELEGFPQEKAWTKYLCANVETNDPIPPSWRLEAPSDIVPDSVRGWVTAVGDLLGPTLDNLGSLIKMPYGCGEQNMINFAPNIFVLQYLEAAGETTPDIAQKAIEFMKSGYQRELRYRHQDGSFSAFGPSDGSGSTWLTAFVLKSFAQARQFIPVDSSDIDMSRDWLKRTQMENGCFQSKGKVLHKAMKGGIADNDSPVPLTAYILTSLLEAGELTASKAVGEAVFCLVSDKSEDPYTLALKSYALALAGAPEASAFITKLLAQAKTSTDGLYWELPAIDGKSAAASVETAAYALLALATQQNPTDYVEEMQKLVRWLSSKRNGNGGFVSTQDTVVALQSLAKYEMVTEQTPVDVTVLTTYSDHEHTFRISHTNKLLLQRVDLPSFPTTVTADVAGEGCALVQAVLRYNIPSEEPSTAFTLSTKTETVPDDNCVTKRIKVCASYTLPDLKSNMAVIEINLVSGYIPEKSDLKQVVGYGTGLIKRYEVDGRKVNFYIDEFSPEELCVTFRARREVDVEDTKPGTVRVYDYYDPDQFVSTSYTFPPNDECVASSEIAAEIEGLIIDPALVDDLAR